MNSIKLIIKIWYFKARKILIPIEIMLERFISGYEVNEEKADIDCEKVTLKVNDIEYSLFSGKRTTYHSKKSSVKKITDIWLVKQGSNEFPSFGKNTNPAEAITKINELSDLMNH